MWNEDLKCSPSTALDFCKNVIPNVYNLKLRKLYMQGVFRTLENREIASNALKKCNVQAVFDGSWNPEITEEVSLQEYLSE